MARAFRGLPVCNAPRTESGEKTSILAGCVLLQHFSFASAKNMIVTKHQSCPPCGDDKRRRTPFAPEPDGNACCSSQRADCADCRSRVIVVLLEESFSFSPPTKTRNLPPKESDVACPSMLQLHIVNSNQRIVSQARASKLGGPRISVAMAMRDLTVDRTPGFPAQGLLRRV